MSDASRRSRRALVLRFILIALVVLSINVLLQLFLGASLGLVENLCWVVSALLMGWAGTSDREVLPPEDVLSSGPDPQPSPDVPERPGGGRPG